MGLISALVYLLAIVNFLPFAFKRDIAAATFGTGGKIRPLEVDELENGRFLHRFPLEKVRFSCFTIAQDVAD
jgi:UDP-N-acetylglucosamine--dolichyl-phosphate N-acetylglucosaminephosphotransferase